MTSLKDSAFDISTEADIEREANNKGDINDFHLIALGLDGQQTSKEELKRMLENELN